VWSKAEQTTVVDVVVGMDTAGLQGKLQQFLPEEKNITVASAADSLVLSGSVSDAVKVSRAVALAEAFGAKTVVNLLRTAAPQQVMLEVKIAEISKTLLDKLGVQFKYGTVSGSWTYSILSDFLTETSGVASAVNAGGKKSLTLDAEKKDGLVKVLAEPNIMAISGQKGSFLAGGKIFIPVARTNETTGGTTITLEEKEFGVGLVFTPTVLEGGRINLNLTPEVSEVLQAGTPFTTVNNTTAILPSFTVRRASTTVQLNDGQSFAIAGLIKNNVNETIKAFPILGEIPILGALFRSSEFQNDRTELVFVVTPRLVKPLPPNYKLPTDDFIAPTRSEFFLEGKMEGTPKEPQPAEGAPKAAVKGAEPPQQEKPSGFEMK
jgi:pilus assembly protein CpaC